MEKQADAAQECEVGQDIGVAAAGGVLAEGGVAAVVIAIFDPGPVRAAQVDPVLGSAFFPELVGKIEAFFLALVGGFLDESGAADFQDDATEGEAGAQWLGRAEADLAGFDAPVPASGLGKKGDSAGLMRASSKREGWLPLIWRK